MPTLAVRAVHIVVTHGDVECALCPYPQFIEEGVVTMERLHHVASVPALAILDVQDFYALGQDVPYLMAVEPAHVLVFLFSLTCDVLTSHRGRTAYHVYIGLYLDQLPCLLGTEFDVWSTLAVVRQGAYQRISLHLLGLEVEQPAVLE